MHPAVELLINRMKTNPEDFRGNSKWLQAFNDYKKHFTKEDLISAEHAYKEMRMVQFQGRLFDLLTQEEQKQEELDLTMAPISISGSPVNYGTSTATWSTHGDEIEELKKDLEIKLQQTKLEMENELNNPRL